MMHQCVDSFDGKHKRIQKKGSLSPGVLVLILKGSRKSSRLTRLKQIHEYSICHSFQRIFEFEKLAPHPICVVIQDIMLQS